MGAGSNLEYVISIDVARALRDVGALTTALQDKLASAAQRARNAIGALERATVRAPSDPGSGSRQALPAPARASSALLAAGAGAVAARAAFANRIAPIMAPAAARGGRENVTVDTGSPAATAATAAREITHQAREAFAPLRLAMSRLALPGGSRAALPMGGSAGSGRVVDVEATVVSTSAKAAGGMTRIWQRALGAIQSTFAAVKQGAAGIVARIDVGGALRSLGSLVTGLRKVQDEERKTHEEGGKGGGMLGSLGGMAKGTLGPLAALAAGYFTLSFAARQAADVISNAAQYEQTKVGFGVLLGSAAKAKAMLQDLTKFADTTPFRMPEVAQAARTLLAFSIPAKDVMKDIRMLGDISAGVQQPLGEIAELFGKCRTEGTLFSIDIRELTRRGIPIIGALAKQFGVNETAIHGMAETGRIKFADLEKAFAGLTSGGGMFSGMLVAQGQTFAGLMTTMEDAWGALQREFGTPILEPLKTGVQAVTALLAGWKGKASEWGATLAQVMKGVLAIIQNGDAGAALGAGLKLAFAEGVDVLYKGTAATVATLLTGIGQAVNVLFKGLASGGVWKTLADGMAYVGAKLGVAIMRALAAAFAEVPGMSKVALGLNTAANSTNTDANRAMAAVREDLKKSDVRELIEDVKKAATTTGNAFTATYANTAGPMQKQADEARAALAAVMQRANDRTNPLPVSVDNEGNEYGPGAPYGSHGSQQPAPGSKPVAADFGAALGAFVHGQLPAPEADPGEGTINGQAASSAVGAGRPVTLPGGQRPLTLPHWRWPTVTPPDLDARASAYVGAPNGARDPNSERTAKAAEQMAGHLATLVAEVMRGGRDAGARF